jgi:trimeric autotransporter adhesin
LVAYSGFTANDHLRQPPNSDMNIGTGDAHEMIWYKTSSTSNTMMLISYEGGVNGTTDYGKPFNIRMTNGLVRGWASHNGFSTYDDVGHGVSTADGTWHHAAWVKRGQVFELYVDGRFIGSVTGAVGSNALSDANSELVIGGRKRGLAPGTCQEPFNGSLALARIGKSAPSPEQIKKIYEDEKVLFQENAKCTLYGSSDAVTALAYDEVNDLLHVGTSSGRSDFNGLRRINNTTTAVTTAISASNGLIAEQ